MMIALMLIFSQISDRRGQGSATVECAPASGASIPKTTTRPQISPAHSRKNALFESNSVTYATSKPTCNNMLNKELYCIKQARLDLKAHPTPQHLHLQDQTITLAMCLYQALKSAERTRPDLDPGPCLQ